MFAMYSAKLLEHFENPRHSGELKHPTAQVRIENPVCGDILELSAEISDCIIQSIRFRAKGCVPSIACSSAMCELAHGKSVDLARRISVQELTNRVGGIPQASLHAAHLALEGLRKLLDQAS